MKKCALIFSLIVTCILSLTCCKVEVLDIETYDPLDVIGNLGFWETQKMEGNANTVTVELERDVDFLAWTKGNGEFLELPIPKGQKFDATFKYGVGTHVFTFKEPGTYILTIHQKPEPDFNNENLDFQGKITVGKQAVKITDKGYAGKCPELAVFSVQNDSKAYGSGNTINELIYVEYNKSESWKKCIYKLKYKYNNLKLKPGDSITLLFPAKFSNSPEDIKKGGLILKPVVKDGNTVYIGQTTCRDEKYSMQGIMFGISNGTFSHIGNDQFECEW